MVCRQLNMEESVAEIKNQLGADEMGRFPFRILHGAVYSSSEKSGRREVGLLEVRQLLEKEEAEGQELPPGP